MHKITGLNSQTTIQVPLVRLEALWALKLQAGRSQDIADLFSVSNRKFYEKEVVEIFRMLKCDSLTKKLESTKIKLRDPKTYPDIRSALHLKDNNKLRKEWEAFTTAVEGIVNDV
jgi:predicted nucleotidyltransferase component of viral defense system